MGREYHLDAERSGRVEVNKDGADDPASIWASCDLAAGERMDILSEADRHLRTDDIPHGTTIGEVTITDGDIEFTPDDGALEEYGHEN